MKVRKGEVPSLVPFGLPARKYRAYWKGLFGMGGLASADSVIRCYHILLIKGFDGVVFKVYYPICIPIQSCLKIDIKP